MSYPGIPSTTSGRAYVHNGRITRDRPTLPRFYVSRIVIVLSTLAVMVVTNPANVQLHSWLPRDFQAPSYNQPQKSWIQRPKVTNYGVLALEKTFTTIQIVGLSRTVDVCYFDTGGDLSRSVCNTIAENLCHGRPMIDWDDLPYSTCQFVSIVLIGSMLFSFCTFRRPPLRATRHQWIDSAISIFHDIRIIDVIRWNGIGYPTLRSMRRVVTPPFYTTIAVRQIPKGFIDANFILGCIVLIFGVGVTANFVGTRFKQNERVAGIDSLLAACLGYNVAVGNAFLFSFLNARITNTTYFWLEVGHLWLSGQYGTVVAVLTGGTLGHAFGIMHRELFLRYVVEMWRYDWSNFWFGTPMGYR